MPQRHASAHELRQLPPFAHLSKQELRLLERLRTNISVPPGTVLARQGHRCLEFGIVVEGTARVTRDGREIALLESGQHFGEIGIVRAVPNPVTIVACTAVTLEVMSVAGVPLGVRDDACATRPHRCPDRSPDRDLAGSEAIRSRSRRSERSGLSRRSRRSTDAAELGRPPSRYRRASR